MSYKYYNKRNLFVFAVFVSCFILIGGVFAFEGIKVDSGSSIHAFGSGKLQIESKCPNAFFVGRSSSEQSSFQTHPPICAQANGVVYGNYTWIYGSWNPSSLTSCGQVQTRTASCVGTALDGGTNTATGSDAINLCGQPGALQQTAKCTWVQTGSACSWHANPYACGKSSANGGMPSTCSSVGTTSYCNYDWSNWCKQYTLNTVELDYKCEITGTYSQVPNCPPLSSAPCNTVVTSYSLYCGLGTQGCGPHNTHNNNNNNGGASGSSSSTGTISLPSSGSGGSCTNSCPIDYALTPAQNAANYQVSQTTGITAGTAPVGDPVNLGLAQ